MRYNQTKNTDESAPLNSSPPLSVQRKPHNPTFPPEDVQIANLLLAQLDTGSSTSPDWGAIAKDLKGLLRNARGVQSVWNKLFDELNHSGLAAAAKWSQSEDRVLRQAVAEYILSDAEGTFEDRNKVVARWILVRDRLSEKRQQSLGSLFKRWVEIKDVMINSEGDQAKPEEVGKKTLGEFASLFSREILIEIPPSCLRSPQRGKYVASFLIVPEYKLRV